MEEERVVICPSCGNAIDFGDEFCKSCGKKMTYPAKETSAEKRVRFGIGVVGTGLGLMLWAIFFATLGGSVAVALGILMMLFGTMLMLVGIVFTTRPKWEGL